MWQWMMTRNWEDSLSFNVDAVRKSLFNRLANGGRRTEEHGVRDRVHCNGIPRLALASPHRPTQDRRSEVHLVEHCEDRFFGCNHCGRLWNLAAIPARRALILSLPVVSLLAFAFSWSDHHDLPAVSRLACETLTLVLLGLPFFVPLALAERLQIGFWLAFFSGAVFASLTIGFWLWMAPNRILTTSKQLIIYRLECGDELLFGWAPSDLSL